MNDNANLSLVGSINRMKVALLINVLPMDCDVLIRTVHMIKIKRNAKREKREGRKSKKGYAKRVREAGVGSQINIFTTSSALNVLVALFMLCTTSHVL